MPRFDLLGVQPPPITDRAPRPGDDRFDTVTGRRPVVEHAVGATAADVADVRRGVTVAALHTGQPILPGVSHITGVTTTAGETLRAESSTPPAGARRCHNDTGG